MDNSERNDLIREYFALGMARLDICRVLERTHRCNISVRQIQRILSNSNMRRQAYSGIHDVVRFISDQLQTSGRLHGYRMMHSRCLQHGLIVRKEDVRLILQQLDPDGVGLRLSRRLNRRSYYACGPNFIWHFDGYDKLSPFGLCISGCIDGYSRKLVWLKVYNNNSNPQLIGGYFTEAIKEHGGGPRTVRGDCGTENVIVRDIQNFLHRNTTSNLPSYISGASTANQRIESFWAMLRRGCTHHWINLFKDLHVQGLHNHDFIDKNIVQFCFMATLQSELDLFVNTWNNHSIRQSRNCNVPHGRPNMMYNFPSLYGGHDQLCPVSNDDFDQCLNDVEFRLLIPCDVDVYHVLLHIIQRDELPVATDTSERINLYLHLRQQINLLVQ